MQFLIETKKTYVFTIQFGAHTDSGDAAGNIINTTDYIPNKTQCEEICNKFIGEIKQRPNIFSAIKIGGIRSYKLARNGNIYELPLRKITIYNLKLLRFDEQSNTATYEAICSKGTYIRTLAEDLALSLQSLGFVIELARIKVGIFQEKNSINLDEFKTLSTSEKSQVFVRNMIRIEAILDDISVVDVSEVQAKQIKFGQNCFFENIQNTNLVWVRYLGTLLAIGSIKKRCFSSIRVFNLI